MATLFSAVVGAVVGAGYAIVVSDGSGFVVWVGAGAALVGSLAGTASFLGGALTHRVLRRIGRRAVARSGAVIAAGATTGTLVLSVLLMTKSVYATGAAVGAMLFTCVVASLAVVPLERSVDGSL
ncbi:hypothetical protein [Microbacterium amylolyticum]|uniref:Major facilitator superfamily (MFS) profile domain-containing protein n=1 Tax=Microbacterium amylolyticum TaxID=936337 RepID=A0ABS4ZIA8_9MICO|nr:hypothetical protein [Microbacterium amylolyticum]MBP2437004.1 hypothetical protein [Microbacterium amylolyticum]